MPDLNSDDIKRLQEEHRWRNEILILFIMIVVALFFMISKFVLGG